MSICILGSLVRGILFPLQTAPSLKPSPPEKGNQGQLQYPDNKNCGDRRAPGVDGVDLGFCNPEK